MDKEVPDFLTLEELKARFKKHMLEQNRHWTYQFDERQQRLIKNCKTYAANDPAGMPGHNLALIIAKMTEILDGKELVEPEIK